MVVAATSPHNLGMFRGLGSRRILLKPYPSSRIPSGEATGRSFPVSFRAAAACGAKARHYVHEHSDHRDVVAFEAPRTVASSPLSKLMFRFRRAEGCLFRPNTPILTVELLQASFHHRGVLAPI